MNRPSVDTAQSAGRIRWSVSTCAGRRSSNQDRHLASVSPSGALFAVADGLGGHPGGARAAEEVVELLRDAARREHAGDLDRLLEEASARLRRMGRERPALAGLGAAAVVARISGLELEHAHAGDACLYHWRRGKVVRLTFPHELTAILAREGVLDAAAARRSPLRGRLVSYLGMEGAIDHGRLRLEPGDRLLLASDGALEGGEPGIESALGAARLDLVARALTGAPDLEDNATAVAVEVG